MDEQIAPHRRTRANTATKVLEELDVRLRHGDVTDVELVATGFGVLDEVLGGGLHAGELLLLAGPPGTGKTIGTLQWARNIARSSGRAVFVCYEHEPVQLLLRLLALELGELGDEEVTTASLVDALHRERGDEAGLTSLLEASAPGRAALERFHGYADDLVFARGSGAHTTLDEIETLLVPHVDGERTTALLVDYLQKIPLHPEPELEAEKVTRTVEGLKDLALAHHVPVVAVSAVDADGLRVGRTRLHHLRGSSAVAFEADVVVLLNDKERAVSKVHLTYDPVRARELRYWSVMSVEKNRSGPALVDLEFRKDFAHFRFDPEGGLVAERLVSDHIDEDEL